jgi:hypothetical protein
MNLMKNKNIFIQNKRKQIRNKYAVFVCEFGTILSYWSLLEAPNLSHNSSFFLKNILLKINFHCMQWKYMSDRLENFQRTIRPYAA